eukprot:m.156821 g.156821  ORF g.156821 m.156821 type:complete len:1075 (-) comp16445_c1_seq19:315-3539(-)
MMRAAALLACCCLVQAAKTVPDSCQGTILPYFSDEFETDIGLFVAYLLLMGYFFIGVAVTADLFMNSIEIITSKIKQIKRPDGTILELKIWNDTVANLTLMALGSSAPEILLSIVEVVGRGFEAGELGPGTIVGSAAFNMLMIIAICMTSVKALRVDSIYVLHFTAGSSIFAYIWLYLIVSAISPGEIEVWEAVVTILYFPLFVFVAWLFDTGRLATGAGFIASKMPLPRQHKQLTENASEKLAQELKELEGLDEHSHLTQVAEVRVPWRRKRRLRRLIADIKHQEPGKDPGRVIEQAIAALKDRHALTPGRPEDEPTTIKGLFGFKDSKIKGSWKKQPKLALTISRSELGSDGTLAGGCYIRLVATSNTAEEGVHFKLPQNNRFHFPAGEATEQIATVELLPTEVYQGRKAVELTLEVEGRHHCHWKNRTCRIELKDKLRSKTWLGKMFENLAWMGRAVTQPEPVYNPWLEQIRQSFYPDDDDDDDDDYLLDALENSFARSKGKQKAAAQRSSTVTLPPRHNTSNGRQPSSFSSTTASIKLPSRTKRGKRTAADRHSSSTAMVTLDDSVIELSEDGAPAARKRKQQRHRISLPSSPDTLVLDDEGSHSDGIIVVDSQELAPPGLHRDHSIVIVGTSKIVDPLDRDQAVILETFPDADPKWVRQELLKLHDYGVSRCETLSALMLERGYTKFAKQGDGTKSSDRERVEMMTTVLLNAFPKVTAACLRVILDAHWPRGYAYVAGIVKDMLEWCERGRPPPSPHSFKFRMHRRPRKTDVLHFETLDKDIQVDARKLHSHLEYKPPVAPAPKTRVVEEDDPAGMECICCYGLCAIDTMVQCGEGHLCCFDCINGYVKATAFGETKSKLTCMYADGCTSIFTKSQLQRALPVDLLNRFEARNLEENIAVADIPNLVRCPAPDCTFAMVMDDDNDKVFRCQVCHLESCRLCKAKWSDHFGLTCKELESTDETLRRTRLEESMTNALIRLCPKCKMQFLKETGCNKMTCRCGTLSCYQCRAIISRKVGYNHFCQHVRNPGQNCKECKKCSLWTKDQAGADARAIAEAKQEEERRLKTQQD